MKEFLSSITKHMAWLWLATVVLLVVLLVWNFQLQAGLGEAQNLYRSLAVQSKQNEEDLRTDIQSLKSQNDQTARDLKTAMPPGFIFPNVDAIAHVDKALATVMQIDIDGIDQRPNLKAQSNEPAATPVAANTTASAKSKAAAAGKDSKDKASPSALAAWWEQSKPVYKDKIVKLGEEILGSWIRVRPIASVTVAQQSTEHLLATRAQIALYLQTAKLALQAEQNSTAEQNLQNAKALAQKIFKPSVAVYSEMLREIDASLNLLKAKG